MIYSNSDMIYKKRMHPLILLVISLALCSSEDITLDKNASQNPVKRFNLQDLLGQQNIQISGGGDRDAHLASPKTQTIDVQELLAAAQKAAANQPQAQPKQEDIISKFVEPKQPKSVDIDITADKNGNFNLENIPGLTSAATTHDSMNMNDLQSLLKPNEDTLVPSAAVDQNNVVREEINLGKQKLEIESAGKRATRYTLAKGPDGGLNLVPIVNDEASGRSLDYMQPKVNEEKGRSRQQMQLTTLSQALYSPFPADANILHLHLRGKDGKDGKPGNKGSMGPFGPKGPDGPKGPKGDAGTCSSQINGLFECTPDELDSLSNRVDYLEKICKKVENAAKKHNLVHSNNKSSSTSSSPTTSSTKSEVSTKTDHTTKKDESTEKTEKESSAVKENKDKTSTEKESDHAVKEKEAAKEQTAKEKEDAAREKEIREEVIARLKERETLKIEKEIEENGVTRGKKDEGESKLKEDKEKEKDDKPKEKEADESKKENVATKVEKTKETESSKEQAEETSTEEKSEKKETEPVKKLNRDGTPPTERSMIDIKAKLKIAELDLMDRVNQARAGSKSS